MDFDLIVLNSSSIATFDKSPVRGKESNTPLIIESGAIGIKKDKIVWWGKEADLPSRKAKQVIDANGGLVTPGLVDPHTHLVFAGNRVEEYQLKLRGVSWREIVQRGGGISKTVDETRRASKQVLLNHAQKYAREMLSYGTTTAEVKSGYGLTLEDEVKILGVAKAIDIIDIVPSFLGAHTVPQGLTRREYVAHLTDVMLPHIKGKKLAEFCDVFLDKGGFTLTEARKILEKAKDLGFKIKINCNQFTSTGGIQLAEQLQCHSVDYLTVMETEDFDTLSNTDMAAVLLPGSSFFLHYGYAPGRKLIDKGIIVALGSDFNPGICPTYSLQMIWALACRECGLLPEEAFAALTTNAAYAIGKKEVCGRIAKGMAADLVLWNAKTLAEIPYYFGLNLVNKVIKHGKIAYTKNIPDINN